MIAIVNKSKCCGCASCAYRCPVGCISMRPDGTGFLYPVANPSRCIQCGICEKVCPELNIYENTVSREPLSVSAARSWNDAIRAVSSSGGLFTEIARKVIGEGGVVFAARFDENWQVVHAYTDSVEGLSAFRGAKYSQSRIGEAFKEAASFLMSGRRVLFVGTPCQIAGLKSYLRKDYEGLIAVDVVCHGVPSPAAWKAYLQTLSGRIQSVNFRDKSTGWKNYSFTAVSADGTVTTMPFRQNPFMKYFLSDKALRPACYACLFKAGRSGSDLTLGDFWGMEEALPLLDDDKGFNVVLTYSEKGQALPKSLDIEMIKVSYAEAVAHNHSIDTPPVRPFQKSGLLSSLKKRLSPHSRVQSSMWNPENPRVAILTLPLQTNYGGILQAYALQTTLDRLGYQAEHLQPLPSYRSSKPWWQLPAAWLHRAYRKFIKGDSALRVFENPYKTIQQHTSSFIAKYLNVRYLSESQWPGISGYEAFIVGSDQVWRPKYAHPIGRMFLDFLDDTEDGQSRPRRVAYAASFGGDGSEFTQQQRRHCRSLLENFDAVSVREASGVELCRTLFGREAQQLIDPAMLLSREDYVALVHEAEPPVSKGDMMVYILDETPGSKALTSDLAKALALTPFSTRGRVEDRHAMLSERIQPPVEVWLRGFMDAKFVLTDSYHACVFAILFHKPFLCIGNAARGNDRFHSLLSLFGLEDRLVADGSTALSEKISALAEKNIDWSRIETILSSQRKRANAFLRGDQ